MRHLLRSLCLGAVALLVLSAGSASAQQLQPDEAARLDPAFQAVVAAEQPAAGLTASAPLPNALSGGALAKRGIAEYGAAIFTDDPEALRAAGIRVNSELPTFVTARVTAADLVTLARMPNVRYVEAGDVLYPHNDVTSGWIGARELHDGAVNGTSYRGAGTLVCVIDSGIDWDHGDFRAPADSSQSRIRYVWDQTLSASGSEQTPATRGDSDLSGFDYGVEYSRTDIEDEIDGSPAGFVRSRDTDGHGTHVAGTVAGSGAAHPEQKFAGMAPEADIIAIKAGNGSFSFSNVIDGMNYCGEVAADEGKPVVVNMSLGTDFGPHDGTTVQDQAVDAFVGPGRVAVISAGNDGASNMHRDGTVPANGTESVTFSIPSYTAESGSDNDDVFFDTWMDSDDALTVRVISPGGEVVEQAPGGFKTTATPDGAVFVNNEVSAANSDRNVQVRVFDQDAATPPATGQWTIELVDGAGTSTFYHTWMTDGTIGTNTGEGPRLNGNEVQVTPKTVGLVTLDGADSRYTVGSPGSATKAITVGSYVHRWRFPNIDGQGLLYSNSFDGTDGISGFSSVGPRRDGVQKPEITAPGQATGSALSSDSGVPSALTLPGGEHYVTQGTSMSSPAVAGAVALLLQQDGTLSADRAKRLITNNAQTDDNTGGVPNATWGFGKLDVYRAMADLTGNPAGEREMLAYDDPPSSSQTTAHVVGGSGSEKLAVRITPSVNGTLAGVSLHLSSVGNTSLTGPVNVEVWDDDGTGFPGVKQGSTVKVPAEALSEYSPNYVSMDAAGVNVAENTDYHVVIYPENATDELELLGEQVSVSGRSSVLTGGSATRISHAIQSKSAGEWNAPNTAKAGSWGSLGSDLLVRAVVSSTTPSNLVAEISSVDFTFDDPALPSDVRFIATVSVENNGEPVQGLTPSDFTLREDGASIDIANECVFTPPSAGGTRLADIVFIIDNSGSMGFEQQDVIDNINAFVDELTRRGVDDGLGLTRYGQSSTGTLGQVGGGPIFENGGSITEDAVRFKNDILTRNITSGSNEPGYYSIKASLENFSFRPGAKKVLIIATDETPAQSTSLGTQEDARLALLNADATLYASTTSNYNDEFQPLTDDTNGQIFDIFDDFSTTVADAITGQVSNTYIFSCTSPVEFKGTESPPTDRELIVDVGVSGVATADTSAYDPGSRPRVTRSQSLANLSSKPQQDNQDLTVEVDIQRFTGPNVQSATLYYRNSATTDPYQSVAMNVTSTTTSLAKATTDTYAGTIPASAVTEPGLDFYVRVTDGANSVTLPSSDALSNPLSVAVLPNEPPTLQHELISGSTPGTDLTVTATAEDNTNQLSAVSLFYRMQGNLTYTAVEMTNTGGSTYEAVIPGDEITDAGVAYYIRAADDFDVTTTAGSPSQPLVELAAPTLAGPGDQTLGLPETVDVSFLKVDRALSYEVQIAPDPSFPEADTDTAIVSDTTATFSGLDRGQEYTWRARPLRTEGYPGPFSAVQTFTTYPDQVSASVTQSFGDPSESTSYRLMALPGDRSTALASILSGTSGSDWQAYWDNGSDADYFVSHDGSGTFDLAPGNGFWVLSQNDVSVSETAPVVSLNDDFQTTISLHAGWNIVSNPLDRDVAWSDVTAANGGTLQAIWAWDGSFAEAGTFASAGSGSAYYFLNDQGLSELTIPYPNAPMTTKAVPASRDWLALATLVDGVPASTVRFGLHPQAEDGIDGFDQFAPPARFEAASLRIAVPSSARDSLTSRQQFLAHDVRGAEAAGHRFDVELRAAPDEPVVLQARNLEAAGDRKVVLLDPATGATYDLTGTSSIRFTPTAKTTRLQLLLGDAAYVDAQRADALPKEVTLFQNFPNPFQSQTTVRFALPESKDVRISVYDLLGRRVAVLADGVHRAGVHTVEWNSSGRRPVASGMYLIRLEAGATTRTIKTTVLR